MYPGFFMIALIEDKHYLRPFVITLMSMHYYDGIVCIESDKQVASFHLIV